MSHGKDDISKRLAALSSQQQELLRMRLRQRQHAAEAPSPATPPNDEALADRDGPAPGTMRFSLFFFSDDGSKAGGEKYDLLLQCAKFADRHGYEAVWTPERHFQDFGGLYPNPSVLGAALAAVTTRVQIRAGSVVIPLHHPVRLAEEWSVVDNLSGGRVAISIATGWHPHDFVLAPGRYDERRDDTYRNLEIIQRLWSGDAVSFEDRDGRAYELKILPRPVQDRLPIWVSIAGNPDTWIHAGEIGANVLTALPSTSLDDMSRKFRLYRRALRGHGHDPRHCTVSVMLHTFLGEDDDDIRRQVRAPMIRYLKTFFRQKEDLIAGADEIETADKDAMMSIAFDRYFRDRSLLGTPQRCAPLIDRLIGMGVNEIACLVDFGLPTSTVLKGLEHLNLLKDRYAQHRNEPRIVNRSADHA
ncbi:MAG: hypothetical protein CMJ18_14940 [Phycisphaeraceae bacterium]|nr:hypothetical protein [Phycisphaeraceae bacterium]